MKKMKLSNICYLALGGCAIALGIYTAVLACTPVQAATYESAYEHSWRAYCAHEGIWESDTTEENINRFYDTWRGSALEEAALTAEEVALID
jgi:hypothetical protein